MSFWYSCHHSGSNKTFVNKVVLNLGPLDWKSSALAFVLSFRLCLRLSELQHQHYYEQVSYQLPYILLDRMTPQGGSKYYILQQLRKAFQRLLKSSTEYNTSTSNTKSCLPMNQTAKVLWNVQVPWEGTRHKNLFGLWKVLTLLIILVAKFYEIKLGWIFKNLQYSARS